MVCCACKKLEKKRTLFFLARTTSHVHAPVHHAMSAEEIKQQVSPILLGSSKKGLLADVISEARKLRNEEYRQILPHLFGINKIISEALHTGVSFPSCKNILESVVSSPHDHASIDMSLGRVITQNRTWMDQLLDPEPHSLPSRPGTNLSSGDDFSVISDTLMVESLEKAENYLITTRQKLNKVFTKAQRGEVQENLRAAIRRLLAKGYNCFPAFDYVNQLHEKFSKIRTETEQARFFEVLNSESSRMWKSHGLHNFIGSGRTWQPGFALESESKE